MKIAVCLKQVPASARVRIDTENGTLIREGYDSVLNPFDSYALEAALQLREKYSCELIALTMGPESAARILRDALALGADRAVLLCDREFAGSDTWATSLVLSSAVKKIGGVSLVVCGRQAIDGDTAQTGPELAAHLGWHQAVCVSGIEAKAPGDGCLAAERVHDNCTDMVALAFPAVISVMKDINTPRLPTLRGKLEARGKAVEKWDRPALGLPEKAAGLSGSPTRVVKVFPPPAGKKDTIFLEGEVAAVSGKLYEIIEERLSASGFLSGSYGKGDNPGGSESGEPAFPERKQGMLFKGFSAIKGMGSSILVAADCSQGRVHQVTDELYFKALELSDEKKCGVYLFFCGSFSGNYSFLDRFPHAAGFVITDDKRLTHFNDETEALLLSRIIKKYSPEIVLSGATARGRAVMPRAAAICGAGLTADCTSLEIDRKSGLLVQTRPAFGGNLYASIITENRLPQMATVRPGVFRVKNQAKKGEARTSGIETTHCHDSGDRKSMIPAALETLDTAEADALKTIISTGVSLQRSAHDLSGAEFVVSGGRGMGSREGFDTLRRFASVSGAAVGASRAAVDAGFAPGECQVGQTGHTVSPVVYLSCGISGQLQHLAGMQSSDFVIAVNRDVNSPLMKIADVAVAGDAVTILKALTEVFETMKKKQ